MIQIASRNELLPLRSNTRQLMNKYVRTGQKIGLLGGSFDPPHAGHVHISREALKRFNLDKIWWLVSPGNPLKSDEPATAARRIQAAQDILNHPRIEISDFEIREGTRYTAETVQRLQKHYPSAKFIWLMGADNLAQFHHWKDWQDIMNHIPIGVLARPAEHIRALRSKAARIYKRAQLRNRDSHLLAQATAPVWCFVNVPMTDMSSTRLRTQGQWSETDT